MLKANEGNQERASYGESMFPAVTGHDGISEGTVGYHCCYLCFQCQKSSSFPEVLIGIYLYTRHSKWNN